MTDEFMRKIAETAHTNGKRLWIYTEPYLVIWSLSECVTKCDTERSALVQRVIANDEAVYGAHQKKASAAGLKAARLANAKLKQQRVDHAQGSKVHLRMERKQALR